MARAALEDYYQNFRFHLIDITSNLSGLGLPVLALSPQIGFQSISAPSLTVETREIKAGNDPFPISTPLGATIGNITLSRGVFTGDSEFYQWTRQTIAGRGTFRRDLLLVQIHPVLRTPDHSVARFGEVMGITAAALAFDALSGVNASKGTSLDGRSSVASVGLTAAAGVASATGSSIPDVFARIWKMRNVIPVGYRSAGGFSGTDDGVTIQELELSIETFEEVSNGPSPIAFGF